MKWSACFLFAFSCLAGEYPSEIEWQQNPKNYMRYGIPRTDDVVGTFIEVRQWEDSRIDYLNASYAIEIDWANKWKEGVTQALYYHILSGKKPGLILLTKDRKKDFRHILRCQTVCAKYDIKLWVEEVERLVPDVDMDDPDIVDPGMKSDVKPSKQELPPGVDPDSVDGGRYGNFGVSMMFHHGTSELVHKQILDSSIDNRVVV